MATEFEAGIATALAVAKGVRTASIPAVRNPDLDITFDCGGYDADGVANKGVGFAWATAEGDKSGVDAEATAIAYALAEGTAIWGNVFGGPAIWGNVFSGTATCYATAQGGLLLQGPKSNWAMWSKIGYANFEIDSTNEAGEMPLDGIGSVYRIFKLSNSIIAYGRDSIYAMRPTDVLWGSNKILSKGVKSRGAVTNDRDRKHWFIDSKGILWELDSELTKLGYSQLFEDLDNIWMSYSSEYRLVYICNGSIGYVYNPDIGSMTKGPVGVSSIEYYEGEDVVGAVSDIEVPKFILLSDIIDFGNRKEKTITSVEFASDILCEVGVRIHWRKEYNYEFNMTRWHVIGKQGRVDIRCYGVDFKIELAAKRYEALRMIDYIKVDGVFHRHRYIDLPKG